jgi:hypothetical protein
MTAPRPATVPAAPNPAADASKACFKRIEAPSDDKDDGELECNAFVGLHLSEVEHGNDGHAE